MKNLVNNSNFYLGLFLVILGFIFLLNNLHIIEVHARDVLRLWPILLIVWGFKYIPMKPGMRAAVNILMFLIFFLLLIYGKKAKSRSFFNDTDFVWTDTDNSSETDSMQVVDTSEGEEFFFKAEKPDNLKEVDFSLTVPASELKIEEKTDLLYELIAENMPFKLKEKFMQTGDKARLEFLTPETVNSKLHSDAFMEVKLNPEVLWSFDLSAGASQMELDLKEFRIKKLDIQAGASDIEIILGKKYSGTQVDIESGASSVKVHVPKEAGLEVKTSNVLGLNSIDELKKIKRGLYRSENFEKSPVKIYLDISSALSNLSIERY